MRSFLVGVIALSVLFTASPAQASWLSRLPALKASDNDTTTPSKKKKKKKKKKGEATEAPSGGMGLDLSGGMGLDLSAPAKTEAPAKPAPAPGAPPASPSTTPAIPPPPALVGAPPPAAEVSKTAKPKDNKPAPTMTFEAIDVSGKSAERQKLDAAIKEFKDGQYEAASVALHQIMKDPKSADLQVEAQYMLAKSLYRLGMYHSALAQFREILAKGPSTKFFRTGLEWLFFIAHKTVNETVILEEVAKYANYEFPEKFRNEFRYLLAKYHFERARALEEVGQPDEAKKSTAEAMRLLALVPKGDVLYPRAKYMEATVAFKDGQFPQALDGYKEVVRVLNPRGSGQVDPQLRELAFMQLARTHYGHKQNRYAIYYYDKISRGSDEWLESLFEASWAHFRIGQYEKALGNLITLSSPFFRDEYFPEALILKAVTYYENCRYREARAILDEFEKTYQPVHDELEKITSQKSTDAAQIYDLLADVQKKAKTGQNTGTTTILQRILNLALTDKDLKHLNDSINELEGEMDALQSKHEVLKNSPLASDLLQELKTQRTALTQKAGLIARAKLENELAELKDELAKGLRIRFETAEREKVALEDELKEGGHRDVISKYKGTVAVSDEHRYWPFEGEYWRDELGTYEYTLTKGCRPQGRGANEQAAVSP
jgi:tetratricopeptide (TPR) repeat protein